MGFFPPLGLPFLSLRCPTSTLPPSFPRRHANDDALTSIPHSFFALHHHRAKPTTESTPPPKKKKNQVSTQAAVDALLQLEKTARLAEDGPGAKAAALAVVELLHAAREWDQLNEHIALLATKRSQLKMVVQAVVRAAAGWVDAAPAEGGVRERLVDTLLSVTEGKIYVEIDRARLTRARAAAKEAAGDLDAAAELIQEVSVETFGAMAKTEKIDFILEQVRVCLARGDFVRARILSKKVAPRAFVVDDDGGGDGKKKKGGGGENKKKKSSSDDAVSVLSFFLSFFLFLSLSFSLFRTEASTRKSPPILVSLTSEKKNTDPNPKKKHNHTGRDRHRGHRD